MYHFETDARRKRLSITFEGFFTLEDVKSYRTDLSRALASLGSGLTGYSVLIDASLCKPQSHDVVEAFTRCRADIPRAKRVALVVAGALLRMQAERVLATANFRTFSGTAAAEAWLDDPDGLREERDNQPILAAVGIGSGSVAAR